jgi:hypothetical protein
MLSPIHLPFLRKACLVGCLSRPPTRTPVQQTTTTTRRERDRAPTEPCAFELEGSTHMDQLPFSALHILFSCRHQSSASNDAIQENVREPSEIALIVTVSLVDLPALTLAQGNCLRWGDGLQSRKVLELLLKCLLLKGTDLSPHRSQFCYLCSTHGSGLACGIMCITQIEFFWKVIRPSLVQRVEHLSALFIHPLAVLNSQAWSSVVTTLSKRPLIFYYLPVVQCGLGTPYLTIRTYKLKTLRSSALSQIHYSRPLRRHPHRPRGGQTRQWAFSYHATAAMNIKHSLSINTITKKDEFISGPQKSKRNSPAEARLRRGKNRLMLGERLKGALNAVGDQACVTVRIKVETYHHDTFNMVERKQKSVESDLVIRDSSKIRLTHDDALCSAGSGPRGNPNWGTTCTASLAGINKTTMLGLHKIVLSPQAVKATRHCLVQGRCGEPIAQSKLVSAQFPER